MSERDVSDIGTALQRDGSILLPAKGVSMQPMLRNGRDLMRIERTDGTRCRKYDAILFQRADGQFVMHRILKVRESDYWVVGDNCTYGEDVRAEQVLGILTQFQRKGRVISVTAPLYRLYVHLWCGCWRLRFLLLRVRDHVKRHWNEWKK